MGTLKSTAVAAALIAMAGMITGCEDSPLTAGTDFTMTLVADPGTVLIDPEQDITEDTSTVIATVLNADGAPQQGVTVIFTTEGGQLASAAKGVKTDAGGIARDTLTVTVNDPAEIDVTASSASVSATVKITKTTVAPNKPPLAGIATNPQNEQVAGDEVIFDGSGSLDPDPDDFITMFRWVVTSTNPDAGESNPFIAEGTGVSGLSFPSDVTDAFENIQDLTVSLFVTDDPAAPAQFAAQQPIAYRAQATVPYSIVAVRCDDNTRPTAVLAGADVQQVFGAPFSTVNFQLDGSLSSDAETPLETYTFSCGNGSLPVPTGTPSRVVCKYLVDQTPRTYTATLVVVDRGTGQLVGGQYQCASDSQPDQISVTVAPLAGGG